MGLAEEQDLKALDRHRIAALALFLVYGWICGPGSAIRQVGGAKITHTRQPSQGMIIWLSAAQTQLL